MPAACFLVSVFHVPASQVPDRSHVIPSYGAGLGGCWCYIFKNKSHAAGVSVRTKRAIKFILKIHFPIDIDFEVRTRH